MSQPTIYRLADTHMAEAVGNANQPSSLECQDRSTLIFAVDNVDETYQQLTRKHM